MAAEVFLELAQIDNLGPDVLSRLERLLEINDHLLDGLGFCLSEEGDLLSQWRGYADDGEGLAIGFSKTYLEWLESGSMGVAKDANGFKLRNVVYDYNEQVSEISPIYLKAKRLIENGAFRNPKSSGFLVSYTKEELERDQKEIRNLNLDLMSKLNSIIPALYTFKSSAFEEEREWRLLSFFIRENIDKCSYRTFKNRLVPYREYEIRELDRQPILEIILGPKHRTPEKVIKGFVKQAGFDQVTVRRSKASYR